MRDSSVIPLTVVRVRRRFKSECFATPCLECKNRVLCPVFQRRSTASTLAREPRLAAGVTVAMGPAQPVNDDGPQRGVDPGTRIGFHGQLGTSPQTRPPGGGDAPTQRQPQVDTAHGDQEGQEGNRDRRQGRRDDDAARIAGRHRSHRGQAHRAQEPRVEDEIALAQAIRALPSGHRHWIQRSGRSRAPPRFGPVCCVLQLASLSRGCGRECGISPSAPSRERR